MIEVKNISKSFGDKQVLKNVSAAFKPGKTNLIIGASGSGKTVLIKCMVGLYKADEGEVIYDDRAFLEMNFEKKKEIRKEIGMLFQGTALFDSLTVEENVIFPLNMFSKMQKGEKKDRVNFCLERVNLPGTNHLYPSELSGGMKKRVGIARAIVQNPKYLYCDEPNSGLDPQTAVVIDDLIMEITDEFQTTTIINTHDMNSVFGIGNYIVFLYESEKWWEGSNKDIRNCDNKELNDFIFASKFIKELQNKKN